MASRHDGRAPGAARLAVDDDHVYAGLRRGIVEGDYPPGSRLVEQRLAEAFHCSRTPVREAVRRLEAEGLVVVERNRGARVRPLTEAEIGDLYGVRARLEAYAAALAAERHEQADLLALHVAVDRFERAAEIGVRSRSDRGVVRELEEANAAFHDALLAMSRHSRIQTLVHSAVDAPLVFQALQRFSPEELARSATFHRLIAEAVVAREPERAERLMTEHVLQGRDALLARLSDLGELTELFARDGA